MRGGVVVLASDTSHSFFWYSPTGAQNTANTLVQCRNSAIPVDFKTSYEVVPQ